MFKKAIRHSRATGTHFFNQYSKAIMPIFARRQLQRMLNELGPWLVRPKAKDLLARLDSDDPDQALPAEYELALTWGLSKIASVEIDRPVGGRTPDIWSEDFLSSAPFVADVAALSDDAFSDDVLMGKVARIIDQTCNRFCRKAEHHLHYHFEEESGYLPANCHSEGFTRFFRRRCVPIAFQMTPMLESKLRQWLSDGPPREPLRLKDRDIDVIISWRDRVHPMSKTWSSMPALAYDARDNGLYYVLKKKYKQLRGAPNGVKRGILLGDAGCSLLRELRAYSGPHAIIGEKIIRTFLRENAVDCVAVFSPRRRNENLLGSFKNERRWHLSVFHREDIADNDINARFRCICDVLPKPYLHGYQARSWHQQGMNDPQTRGHYLGNSFSFKGDSMTARISARGLLEFIAGRISREEFDRWMIGEKNLFDHFLGTGSMISNIRLEPKGPEHDDDHVVFEFIKDPAAGELQLPDTSKAIQAAKV